MSDALKKEMLIQANRILKAHIVQPDRRKAAAKRWVEDTLAKEKHEAH